MTSFPGPANGREELAQQVVDLQEQVRMNSAFAGAPEKDTNDAILQWRGRNRFLAERIIPVRLKPISHFCLLVQP